MDVNDNVPVEKKTWWQIYRFKILIPALLSVVAIILFIWIINKNKTIPIPTSSSISSPTVLCPASCSIHSHISPVDLLTASISSLARDLSNCRYSSTDLVRWYLMRIDAVNRRGPHPLHAVIETNPDVLTIADTLDRQRQTTGPKSALHGIPILVKDNMATSKPIKLEK